MIDTFLNYFIAKTDWMKTIVGLVFVGVFVFLVVFVLTKAIPDANREIALFVAGEVTGAAMMIGNYYFGSSKGSQEKTEILKQQHAEEAAKKS